MTSANCANLGDTCNVASMTCVAVGLTGDPCTTNRDCSELDLCGTSGTCTLRPRLGIVAVENQHIAAAALRLLQEPAGCCSRSGWRDHFEEAIGADRKEGVLQPVRRDAAVAMAFLDAEQGPDQRRGGFQVGRNQANLAQAQKGLHLSALQRWVCSYTSSTK